MVAKVLFCSVPGFGHALPLVPLAKACVDQRYETAFATGREIQGRLPVSTIIGLPEWSRTDVEAETRRRHPELADLVPDERYRIAVELFADVTAEGFIDTLDGVLGELQPDLVVYEVMSVGAAVAACRRGIPCVCVGVVQRSVVTQLLHRKVVEHHGLGSSDRLVPRAYLDLFPPSMRSDASADPPASGSLRPVPASTVDAEIPSWLLQRRERKGVYLTMGTVAFGALQTFETALDALDRHDVDVLVAIGPKGEPSAFRPRGDHVHIERFVNQASTLAHVDAVVHHGGSGTMLLAMAMGLPQLVMPQGADQFQNAASLESTGAGRSVSPQASEDTLTRAVDDVLSDPAISQAARRMAAEIGSMPTPASVARRLPDLL